MEQTTRILVLAIIAICIIYDLCCMIRGWPTISAVVRVMDEQSGGIIKWFWLALWLHWFGPRW